jgi:hypothetical protein
VAPCVRISSSNLFELNNCFLNGSRELAGAATFVATLVMLGGRGKGYGDIEPSISPPFSLELGNSNHSSLTSLSLPLTCVHGSTVGGIDRNSTRFVSAC